MNVKKSLNRISEIVDIFPKFFLEKKRKMLISHAVIFTFMFISRELKSEKEENNSKHSNFIFSIQNLLPLFAFIVFKHFNFY